MVSNCYVVGCTNYVGKKAGFHFYSFPSDAQWREKWVAAVQEKTGNLANNVCMLIVSLVPRRSGGGAKEKNAWYTLFAHALN